MGEEDPPSSDTGVPPPIPLQSNVVSIASLRDEFSNPEATWNLSHDADLALLLGTMSSKFQLHAKGTAQKLMDLEEQVDGCRVEVRSTVNELLMLSDKQFIENRVYDDQDEDEAESERKAKADDGK